MIFIDPEGYPTKLSSTKRILRPERCAGNAFSQVFLERKIGI